MNIFPKIPKSLFFTTRGVLVVVMILITAAGCRDRPVIGDLGDRFLPSGEEQVRELGIYAGGDRVGDLRLGRLNGNWKGAGPVVQLSERIRLRLSFRGDRFAVSSMQTSYVDKDLDLMASVGVMDFGAGTWETRVLKVEDSKSGVRRSLGLDRCGVRFMFY